MLFSDTGGGVGTQLGLGSKGTQLLSRGCNAPALPQSTCKGSIPQWRRRAWKFLFSKAESKLRSVGGDSITVAEIKHSCVLSIKVLWGIS